MKIEQLTPAQTANFVYWMLESNVERGAFKLKGKVKIAYIEHELLPEFFRKYPDGILTGWTN